MAKVANVNLTDTFNTWRVRSNQLFSRVNQFAITESTLYANTIVANVELTIAGSATLPNGGRANSSAFLVHNWHLESSDFNINSGSNYFADVRSGTVVGTLPGSPSIGDQFRVIVIGNATVNPFKVSRNGERIQGELANLQITTANAGFGLVYANANTGWRISEV